MNQNFLFWLVWMKSTSIPLLVYHFQNVGLPSFFKSKIQFFHRGAKVLFIVPRNHIWTGGVIISDNIKPSGAIGFYSLSFKDLDSVKFPYTSKEYEYTFVDINSFFSDIDKPFRNHPPPLRQWL